MLYVIKQKVNILMVDDHPENILALEAVLASEEYNLMSADSGEQALKYVLQEDFAVILLDVQMPGLNGFETARLIKSREKSRHIPIIFITAVKQPPDHINQGYSAGAIDYLVKPFQPNALRAKVEQFVKIYRKYNEVSQDSLLLDNCAMELQQTSARLDRIKLDLRKSRALARVIADTALDTIITFNAEGYILTANPAVGKMFGYTAEELSGCRIEKLFSPVRTPSGPEIIIANYPLEELTEKITEVTACCKTGEVFPADIQIRQVIFENDCIYVCSIRDVSERKQLEMGRILHYEQLERLVEARTLELLSANTKLQHEIEERKIIADNLRLSHERFRKIFESSPSLMAIISCRDERYIDVNESWVNFTGYSREEVIDQVVDMLNIAFVSGQTEEAEQAAGASLRNARIRYFTKTGQVREALLSLESMDINGEHCQLKVITDITERVFLENKMARFDRMNLIGEMAAGIAHEIRNPMTTVRGFLQMTKQRGNLSPEHIDLMIEELDRANAIISEYLSLAKDKPADRRLQPLNQIIENLLPLIQAEAIRSDKAVFFETAVCPQLYLDEKEIRQMVLNLALNGLEAMKAGGGLQIKTYWEKNTVVLAVADQGCGMRPELLDKVGTPFFTTKEQGTGLGLAVCYSVATRHDAAIEFESSAAGTTVFVRFRLTAEEKQADPETTLSGGPGHRPAP
ncbi:PAS domain S-box protein|nr:PAS domain S-box protein [Dendrosporobacter quercicolus DSM 1736]